MKALILAAGYGTRLKPYTDKRPKPLFPVAGTAMIDITISQLVSAGCDKIIINTHHLADQIDAHIQAHSYPIPIVLSHEPDILGTGGAIKKAAPHLGQEPFWVVNSDILHDIPLEPIYDLHLQHPDPATLVLVDDPTFNTVWLDNEQQIQHLQKQTLDSIIESGRWCTFSGIQVVGPAILDHIPATGFFPIIDAYRSLIRAGNKIRGYFAKNAQWQDLGTPDRFQKAVRHKIAPTLFSQKEAPNHQITITPLAGDGSDRRWSRLNMAAKSVILCEHGITMGPETQEVDAFIAIGNHLRAHGICVPEILTHDRFSGQAYLEDLGDIHLQSVVANESDRSKIAALYDTVVKRLFHLATDGATRFDLTWTYQTPFYDKALILEKECRYFLEAFVNGWCNQSEEWETYTVEFESIADAIVTHGIQGLLHRDMQSRNIMIKAKNDPYFIDFQGARLGPVQYDLASLLIDPYVDLPEELRRSITAKSLEFYADKLGCNLKTFNRGFVACALSRNLQILGAFANLTQKKGKTAFAQYIPTAFARLQLSLAAYKSEFGDKVLPRLSSLAENRGRLLQK